MMQMERIHLRHATQQRMERAEALCDALGNAHPDDAKPLAVAFLSSMAAGDPPPRDPFDNIREDAAFWCDCAHEGELEAYFTAALRRIGKRPIGREARKRLFKELWRSFTDSERAAFIAHVKGGN